MSATILIVGAGGQVGHELSCADSPHRIVGLTRAQLDATEASQISTIFAKHAPDLVINAAAYTQVDRAETDTDQAYAINRDAVQNLAEACAAGNIPLLHISTDYVFSGAEAGAYREDDLIAPRSVYGSSKAAGEQVLRAALPRHIILRTSWVFAATGNNFVKTMLRLGRERTELGIVSDQQGCPTSASSIARCLLDLAERYLAGTELEWGTYHYCGSPQTSWFEFAETIFAMADGYSELKLNRINTSDYPTPAARPANSALNCAKIEQQFGIVQADWKAELREVLRQLSA